MLLSLFGNRNIERILLFLFVNGRCYGSQLHRMLKTPLTPLQKALSRLEKGGIITSYCEGKTRLYQFNPGYPLQHELEQLLKKSYTLLPANEKKIYYLVRDDYAAKPVNVENKGQVILSFWEKLSSINRLTFKAVSKSKDNNGWNGRGKGEVILTKINPHTLIFNEKGSWQGKENEEVDFSNIFRWTLDRENHLVSLEHLRRGPEHPVFLFDLTPSGQQTLTTVDTHLCIGDTYFGQIQFDHQNIHLNWRIIGPKKNEELHYYYS